MAESSWVEQLCVSTWLNYWLADHTSPLVLTSFFKRGSEGSFMLGGSSANSAECGIRGCGSALP